VEGKSAIRVNVTKRKATRAAACVGMLALSISVAGEVKAQDGGGAQGRVAGGQATTARASAPKDFTGYWVAVVTEHWHLRMLMPPKGDFSMLPVNAEARRLAGMWTPAQDAGNECRGYGAAAIMHIPGRLHIHWADDNTMQIDTDSGTQTRMLHFTSGAAAQQATAAVRPDWQGYSVAFWAGAPMGRGGRLPGPGGDLGVTTTKMKAGYLRKNGVPYSENATLQEYFDTFTEPDGDSWLLVTSIVTDPQYLTGAYATTNHFKKIPDGQGWDPTPCRADEVR
jgi:hypothetical protein